VAVTIEVKSYETRVKAQREAAAQRVLQEFEPLPDAKLLAFFDGEDSEALKRSIGRENRGCYFPIRDGGLIAYMPGLMVNLVLPPMATKRVFNHAIYLHGSTCADATALTMTFSHELQHFVQHETRFELWAVSSLIPYLPKEVIDNEQLNWSDIPHEREARIVAKRNGVRLCGADAVKHYIARKISENATPRDVEDWRFSEQLDPSTPYDLEAETKRIFQRLMPYKNDLENVLADSVKSDPDFRDISLAPYFD
jgi:hypothetical protein